MSDIDWSKAPDGATHWGPTSYIDDGGINWLEAFYREVNGKWEINHGDGWYGNAARNYNWTDRLTSLIRRPSQAWSGHGLPPVGTSVEWLSFEYGWIAGRVVGHDGIVTLVAHNDGYAGFRPDDLRPARTPEQLAAEEREKAISGIGLVLASYGPTFRDQATALYDAGYRLTKESTQ